MGTVRSKHMVAEKFEENVGSFKLSSVVTYGVNDKIEKWDASVVEDIIEHRSKIQFYMWLGEMPQHQFSERYSTSKLIKMF